MCRLATLVIRKPSRLAAQRGGTDGKGEGGHGPGLHGGDYVGPCITSTATATTPAATPAATKVWVPLVVGGPTCVDWVFYHSDKTGNLNIFRLGALPDSPTANANVSQGTGSGVQDMSPLVRPTASMWLLPPTVMAIGKFILAQPMARPKRA